MQQSQKAINLLWGQLQYLLQFKGDVILKIDHEKWTNCNFGHTISSAHDR